MTAGTLHEEKVGRNGSEIRAGLRAIVEFGSRLSHRYPSLDFEGPSVLKPEHLRSEGPLRWRCSSGAIMWVKSSQRALTIAVQLARTERPGRLVFWAILDPADADNTLFGVMISRVHQSNAVGKSVRAVKPMFGGGSLCVLFSADLSRVADENVLCMLAKGFSEAAMDEDRDAWAAWLWSEASQGHLKTAFIKRLISKVLGKRTDKCSEPITGNDELDILKALSSVGVFERDADYHLPSGMHAAAHVNLGTACGHPGLVRKIAQRVAKMIEQSDYDTIVSTGWPVAMIAREVIRLRPMTRAGVVRHSEYEGVQPLPLTPVMPGGRVIILTDVVVTGQLVERVSAVVKTAGSVITDSIAIVDASGGSSTQSVASSTRAVCAYDVQAVPISSCPRCGELEPKEFNPVACCMTSKKTEARSPQEFLDENHEAADFWRQVDTARAYEHHRMEGNTHYVSFIDTAKLINHDTVGPIILGKILGRLPRLIGIPDVVLFPAGPARARLLAGTLCRGIVSSGRLWPPNMVAAKQAQGRFVITAADGQVIRGSKVLLVDTAVASGSTLEGLSELAYGAGAVSVAATVIVSRVSDSQEAALSTQLGGRFFRLYQLPIRPRTIPDSLRHLCPVCRSREEVAAAASESQFRPIQELSNEIRARRGRRPASRDPLALTAKRERQLRLAAEAEVPLLEHCRRATASGVTLHSLHAAMNNGMAPLRLPEICNDRIPTANRSAMLEYLGAEAWAWSGDTLLADAKRLLNERDLDEIWTKCAALLNRGTCNYWVEALEGRLAASEIARHQESRSIWNRLAFEVYQLVKRDPSSLPEISFRFHSMRRTCARTPAEGGIVPILEMIQSLADSKPIAVIGEPDQF
jgi:orotate phosphoribosyltransferase